MIKEIMANIGELSLKAIVQIGIIVIAAIITTFYIKEIYNYLIGLYSTVSSSSMPLWFTLVIIVLIVILMFIGLFLNRRRSGSGPIVSAVSVRMRTGDEIEIPFENVGVKWLAYIPRPLFGDKDEYVWLNGPYCPDCIMDLEWKKSGYIFKDYYWYCPRCNKKFGRPAESKYKTLDNVENICYADIFRKEKFENSQKN